MMVVIGLDLCGVAAKTPARLLPVNIVASSHLANRADDNGNLAEFLTAEVGEKVRAGKVAMLQ